MKVISVSVALVCALLLIAGCGDQFRTETTVDKEGAITRTLTFFFAVEAQTLEEAQAALNLDRFTLPAGGKWEKVAGGMGLMGEIGPPEEPPTPAPQEEGASEDLGAQITGPGGGVTGPGAEGWQYVVTRTYKPGEPATDFGYKFPGSKELAPFALANRFQVTTSKREDGSTEYVFTESASGADLDKAMLAVFSGAFVQPVLDALGEDATPELAEALRARVTTESLGMVGQGEPPSGGAIREAFKSLFMDTLVEHVGEKKAEAALSTIARRASRPNYMLGLMGDFLKAAAKIDDIAFLEITDEVTMPGTIESVEGGVQTGDNTVMWTWGAMSGGEGTESSPALKVVSVAK
jgi:hypothetical protein